MSGFDLSSKIDWQNSDLRRNKIKARDILVHDTQTVGCALSLVGRHAEDVKLALSKGIYSKNTFIVTAEAENSVVSEVKKSLTTTGLEHYVHSGLLSDLDVISLLNKLKGRKLDKLILDYCGYPNIVDLLWLNSISTIMADNLHVSFTYLAAPQRHVNKPYLATNLLYNVDAKLSTLPKTVKDKINLYLSNNRFETDIDALAASYVIKYVTLASLALSDYSIKLQDIWIYSDVPSNRMITFNLALQRAETPDTKRLECLRTLAALYMKVKHE